MISILQQFGVVTRAINALRQISLSIYLMTQALIIITCITI